MSHRWGRDQSSTLRQLARMTMWLSACAVVFLLWPARFGGSATILIVQGNSMQPALGNGDLVVARSRDTYHAGDIVVFDVNRPGVASSARVMHRIMSIAADGTIITQGDNRATADEFGTTTSDIVGEAQLTIPNGGTILWVLSRWWTLAGVAGVLTILALLGTETPSRPRRRARRGPVCIVNSL